MQYIYIYKYIIEIQRTFIAALKTQKYRIQPSKTFLNLFVISFVDMFSVSSDSDDVISNVGVDVHAGEHKN